MYDPLNHRLSKTMEDSQIKSTNAFSLALFIIWYDRMVNKGYIGINIYKHSRPNNFLLIVFISKAYKIFDSTWWITHPLSQIRLTLHETIQIFRYPPHPQCGLSGVLGFIFFSYLVRFYLFMIGSPPWYGGLCMCDFLNQYPPHIYANPFLKNILK